MVTFFHHCRARRILTSGRTTKTTNTTIIEVAETMETISTQTEITTASEVTDHVPGVVPARHPRTKIADLHAQLRIIEAQGDTRRPRLPSIIQSAETSTPKRSSSRFKSDSTTSLETLRLKEADPLFRCTLAICPTVWTGISFGMLLASSAKSCTPVSVLMSGASLVVLALSSTRQKRQPWKLHSQWTKPRSTSAKSFASSIKIEKLTETKLDKGAKGYRQGMKDYIYYRLISSKALKI